MSTATATRVGLTSCLERCAHFGDGVQRFVICFDAANQMLDATWFGWCLMASQAARRSTACVLLLAGACAEAFWMAAIGSGGCQDPQHAKRQTQLSSSKLSSDLNFQLGCKLKCVALWLTLSSTWGLALSYRFALCVELDFQLSFHLSFDLGVNQGYA